MDYVEFYKENYFSIKENLLKYTLQCSKFNNQDHDFEQIEKKSNYLLTTKYDTTQKLKKFEEYKIMNYQSEEFSYLINTMNYGILPKDNEDIIHFNLTNLRESPNLSINTGIKLEREIISSLKYNLSTEEWCTVYRSSDLKTPLLYIVNKFWQSHGKDLFKAEIIYKNVQQNKKVSINLIECKETREIKTDQNHEGSQIILNYKEEIAPTPTTARDTDQKNSNLDNSKFSRENIKKTTVENSFKKDLQSNYEMYTIEYQQGGNESSSYGTKKFINTFNVDGNYTEYIENWSKRKDGENKVKKEDITSNGNYYSRREESNVTHPDDNGDIESKASILWYKEVKDKNYKEEGGEDNVYYKNNCKKLLKYSKDSCKKELYDKVDIVVEGNTETLVGKLVNDEGNGNRIQKEYGHKKENNEKVSEYCDTTEDLGELYQTIKTKKGFSKICGNEWSSSIKQFHNEGLSWVENYGKNNLENSSWYERWSESETELKGSKFGRNSTDEWQENWEEKFTDASRLQTIYKSCVKKNKKLNSCIQWHEEWIELYKDKGVIQKKCKKWRIDDNNLKHEESWEDLVKL